MAQRVRERSAGKVLELPSQDVGRLHHRHRVVLHEGRLAVGRNDREKDAEKGDVNFVTFVDVGIASRRGGQMRSLQPPKYFGRIVWGVARGCEESWRPACGEATRLCCAAKRAVLEIRAS